MNIVMRRLSEFTLPEVTSLWNEGFKGYAVEMSMSMDAFIKRFPENNLSLELSLAACVDGRPVGFVINGFRTIDGKRTAYNGGTGIVPEYRNKGIAKLLIGAALELYKEQGVETALLEALSDNEPAIMLYKRMGYREFDELRFYDCKGSLQPGSFIAGELGTYEFRRGVSQDIQSLGLPIKDMPWQTQWENVVNGGESVIALDAGKRVAGYALYKRGFDDQGKHISTNLYQCRAADENSASAESVIRGMLAEVFGPLDRVIIRRTVNLPVSESLLTEILEQAGFELRISQVHMKCDV